MRLGLITGSFSDTLSGLEDATARVAQTRFGEVELTDGMLAGARVVHVSRHGEGHARLSSHVNHRANITALAQSEVDAVLAVSVCGALDPTLELGTLIVFDDLHFLSNRLPDGSLCTLYGQPGADGRGHWIFAQPFSQPLRAALLEGARDSSLAVLDGGCYGHVDGPRFNSRAEIRTLHSAGVTAISQTAGPETVLAGEAQLPYALLGNVTDYANGVTPQPNAMEELMRLLEASTAAFASALAAAASRLVERGAPPPTGTVVRVG